MAFAGTARLSSGGGPRRSAAEVGQSSAAIPLWVSDLSRFSSSRFPLPDSFSWVQAYAAMPAGVPIGHFSIVRILGRPHPRSSAS